MADGMVDEGMRDAGCVMALRWIKDLPSGQFGLARTLGLRALNLTLARERVVLNIHYRT